MARVVVHVVTWSRGHVRVHFVDYEVLRGSGHSMHDGHRKISCLLSVTTPLHSVSRVSVRVFLEFFFFVFIFSSPSCFTPPQGLRFRLTNSRAAGRIFSSLGTSHVLVWWLLRAVKGLTRDQGAFTAPSATR